MNYKKVINILGKVLLIDASFMCLPMIVNFIYGEKNFIAYFIPILIALALGMGAKFVKSDEGRIYAKEGFLVVALSWIIMSLLGALPFCISGEIPNYIDAVFETVSGFTTTGATIIEDLSVISKSNMFWRLFTHFIGGMGVIVFFLAIMPKYDSGLINVYKAESPGPSASKLVSKMSYTARILYVIYISITILETIFLLFGGLPFYDALLYSFSSAGTGGFSISNLGLAQYNSIYVEMVIAVFLFLFGVNFNVYYLILVKNVKKAFKNEEVIVYFAIVVLSTLTIGINLLSTGLNFGESIRYAFFQTTSVTSTTGLTTANFYEWPALSQSILFFLTIMGACGGSTGGGIKVSRLIILLKSARKDIQRLLHPNQIYNVKIDGVPLEKQIVSTTRAYFIVWIITVFISTLILSLNINDLFSNFSISVSCIGNVGPGLTERVFGNLSEYAWYSKLLLSFEMLFGRLEIFPMVILFSLSTWKK